MAALDNDQLVVRVVYTGPPMAGKTQSVRALMPLLKGKGADPAVMSPGEWRGRTAFFDFADYVGGAYEGKPIRCQILSTPGQIALSDRRELLLRAADAVIMVVASQPEALERAMQSYEEMAPWLADAGRDVPIRLILQCNKQDLPDAIPSDEIGRLLRLPCGKDVYATSARTGKGLRPAFVAGVRIAVERARALVAKGAPLGTLEIESGQDLFERMRREVAPLGSLQPRAPSAHPLAPAMRTARLAARAPSTERPEGKPSRAASSANPSARPARSPTKPSQSGLYPSASLGTTAALGTRPSTTAAAPVNAARTRASTRTTTPGQKGPFGTAATRPKQPLDTASAASGAAVAGGVPRPKPSEPVPAEGAHSPARELGNPKVSSAPPSGSGRPAPRGSREPAAASKRAPAAEWRPLVEGGPAAPGAGRPARARAAGTASASSASASTGSAAAARGAASAALGDRADGVTVRAPAPREPAPASSARRAIILPPAELSAAPDAIEMRGVGGISDATETLAITAAPNAHGLEDTAAPARANVESSSGPARGAGADPGSEARLSPLADHRKRPAVMPATAYFAALAAGGVMPTRATPIAGAAAARVDPDAPRALPESPVQPARASRRSSRPAVMPARAWRSALLIQPESSSPEWAAPRRAGGGSDGLRESSTTTSGDAPDAPTSRMKTGAMPALRPDNGGTPRRSPDEASLDVARPDVPSWEVAPPDDASWDVDPSDDASSDVASAPAASSNAAAAEDPSLEAELSRAPSLEAPSEPADAAQPSEGPPSPGLLPPGVQAAPGHDVSVATPDRYRLTRASTHGLEFSSLIPGDEPSESFRIPETPPGLQAFVAASRRALFPHSATEHGGDERDDHDPGTAVSVNAASESPPGNATLSGDTAGALPSEPTAAPQINPCADTVGPLSAPLDTDSEGDRLDSVRAMSIAATPPEDETPPFSFPGPRLPGQARIPRAVWPRARWRTLETQITAYASAISDARGRWIGELAPGWFARTLRKAPDERVARRAFAEQVLRERKLGRYLSRPRCVVLTEETDGFWIWQVACRVPTLATILRQRLGAGESPSEMAGALLDAALGYLDARQRFVEARVPLPLSPHALSFQDGRIVYSGLMPDPGAVFVEPAGNGYAALQDALRKMWPDAPVDAPTVLAELHGKAAGRLPEPLLEIIRSVLGQR
jgi:signal recognition particle receptor subunit beta